MSKILLFLIFISAAAPAYSQNEEIEVINKTVTLGDAAYNLLANSQAN